MTDPSLQGDLRSPIRPTPRSTGMTNTHLGLLTGLVLGVVAAFGGFGAFLVVLLLTAVGLVVGRVLDGKLDLQAVLGRSSSRR